MLSHHHLILMELLGRCNYLHFFFLFAHTCCMRKFLGQGWKPCHSSDLIHSSDNNGSLTCWTTRELHYFHFLLSEEIEILKWQGNLPQVIKVQLVGLRLKSKSPHHKTHFIVLDCFRGQELGLLTNSNAYDGTKCFVNIISDDCYNNHNNNKH